jgi:two-component system, cell cycle response regulator
MMPVIRRLFAVALCALLPGTVRGQSTAELETRLPTATGVERARLLSRLVNLYKLDQPKKALERGAEALRVLETSPEPATLVSTLNEMGWAHMTLGRYDSATAYGENARRIAVAAKDRAGEARALSNLGTLAQRMGDPRRAVDLFTDALAIQRAAHADADIANSLNNLGYVYSTDLADYAKSLDYHLESLDIRQRLGDKASIALSLNNIGIVYGRLRQPLRALEYYEQALGLRRELGNQSRIAATLNNMGDTYAELGDYQRALANQREALSIRATLGDRSAIALSHHNLGTIYVAMNRLDMARAEFEAAQILVAQAGGDRGIAVQVHLGMSSLERRAGVITEADRHARMALVMADSMHSRELVRRSSEALAVIQEEKGELSAALSTFKRSKAVSDSIFSVETARQIATFEQRYQNERRAREMEALRRSEAELALQARNRALQRDGAAALSLLVLVVGGFLYRRRIDRLRLVEEMSVTDALTGARNRRYLEQTIEPDLASSLRRYRAAFERATTPDDPDVVFFLLDLDGFKEVNDVHGHAAGDRLLTELAQVLENTARDSDVVVRWGGDEFLVVGRFMDHHNAPVAAERIRAAIADHKVTLANGSNVSVTCSVGFAHFPFDVDASDSWTWQDLVRLADMAAYSVKREGGNGWAGYETTSDSPDLGGELVPARIAEWISSGQLARLSSRTETTAEVVA